MFQLSTKPKEIRWKIEGNQPDEARPGQFKKFWFYATLKQLTKDQYNQMREEAGDDLVAFVRGFVSDWELFNDKGEPVDFKNDDAVRYVMSMPHLELAIIRSYHNMITGGATAKN